MIYRSILSRLTLTSVLLSGALVGCSPESNTPRSERPTVNGGEFAAVLSNDKPKHVLLIVIDTLRADHLSCYGYWRNTSPSMDQLAQRGVRFECAISQSSWTSPSMITMMTGQRLSARRLSVPEDKPTLAELFKDAGYRTGAFVTNDLLSPENGFNRGFDTWLLDVDGLNNLDTVRQWIIDRRDEDTFTWVHFTDPHDPYDPPVSDTSGEPGRLPESTIALMRTAVEKEGYGGYEQQRAFISNQIGRYDDEIVSVDRKVRELVGALSEVGVLDNSIVVVTSDHGECLWQRLEADIQVVHQAKVRKIALREKELAKRRKMKPVGEGRTALSEQREKEIDAMAKTRLKHRLKQTHGTFVYQEFVRVPLIISAPGLEPGTVRSSVAESVHLASTLLALAGVQVQGVSELHGKNLFGQEIPDGGYAMTNQGEAFIDNEGWKLILPTTVGRDAYKMQVQLYDLDEDPDELNNLAAERPELVVRLTLRIQSRRSLALPMESGESWDEAALKNAQVLRDLGYLGGGFLDEADESEDKNKPDGSRE